MEKSFKAMDISPEEDPPRTAQSTPASVRREQWRETQQQSIGSVDDYGREDCYVGEERRESVPESLGSGGSSRDAQDPFCLSPYPSRSPQSSFSSPQVSVESPRISFSPLQIKGSIEEEAGESTSHPRSQSLTVPEYHASHHPSFHVCDYPGDPPLPGPRSPRGRASHAGHRSPLPRWQSPGPETRNSLHPTPQYSPRARSVSPISPVTRCAPRSPVPGHYFGHYEQYFRTRFSHLEDDPDTYRRWMSDTDLSFSEESAGQGSNSSSHSQDIPEPGLEQRYETVFYSRGTHLQYPRPPKTNSVDSDQSSSTQDFPLDLSMSSGSTSDSLSSKFLLPSSSSSTSSTRQPLLSSSSFRSLSSDSSSRGSCDPSTSKVMMVSPVVETTPTGSLGQAYLCPICHQMFSVHDRLAKHMASRHKSKSTESTSKAYLCEVCKRTFARSDMLTRHMRLHTGFKPYSCKICGQVFSRSDHLSTHQRTHTGEKPYRCPSCPYSACRRDMITRHLRTHSRYETMESSGVESMDDSMSSSRLEAARSVSTESESSEKRLSREVSCEGAREGAREDPAHLSADIQDSRLTREFSESRLSRDFSENRLSFDLTEGRFLGEKTETFTSQSSRDFPDNQQLVEDRLDRHTNLEAQQPGD